ncbi:B12-binding domain-containing radical SAM protein [Candidatus Sumerlaeota bacterium]|nr:B12-binding domain-containing radical SAM protein [Candidatus Sumerlaeota bacterium]
MPRMVFITTYNPGAIGPRYIGANLKSAGHEVWFVHFKEMRTAGVPTFDYEHHRRLDETGMLFLRIPRPGYVLYVPYPKPITETEKQLLVKCLKEIKPDIIGFSFYSVTLEQVKQLTALIREELPGIPIMWGGLHCIVRPEECIQYADIVCAGEGEEVTVQLLNNWDEYKKGKIPEIPGLWFRQGEKIISSSEHPVVQDLDKLPIPLAMENELLIEDDVVSEKMNEPGDFLNAHIYIFTERGCPYKCAYCIHSMLRHKGFKRFRRRSVDSVLAETADRVNRLGMKHIIYHDEIFVIQREWVREFTRKFKEQFGKYGITYTGYVHPMTTDYEMLSWMVDAGLTVTGVGIQSGSERVCKEVYHRPWMPDETIKLSEMLSKFPLKQVQYEVITNSVFETDDDRRETLEFLLKLYRPFDIELFGLVVYPICALIYEKPLVDHIDEKNLLFWNMLYHLTGVNGVDKDYIRELSTNSYLREHPEELEKFVIAVTTIHKERQQLEWEKHQLNKALSFQQTEQQPGVRDLVKKALRKAKLSLLPLR